MLKVTAAAILTSFVLRELNCGSALFNSVKFQSVSWPLDAAWLKSTTPSVLFDIPQMAQNQYFSLTQFSFRLSEN